MAVDENEWAKATKAMADAGAKHGKNSGGWVTDGNTKEETLRNTLKQWDDGDPAAPTSPSPFSMEWADDTSVEEMIDQETDLCAEDLTPEERDELATAYEDAFHEAWQDEAERTVRGLLPDPEPVEEK